MVLMSLALRVVSLVGRRVPSLAEFRVQVLLALGAEDSFGEEVVDGVNERVLADPIGGVSNQRRI
jgi:hypothetical protein